MFFDLFGSNWVENDNHWDEGLDSTPTKISTQTKAAERVERKLGRKNKDAKARRVDGEDRDDIGLIKARTLKGPLHSEVAFKQQDNELALQLPKDNHSKTVSDILQKVRRGFYQMGSSMKVGLRKRRHGCLVVKNYGFIVSLLSSFLTTNI